MVSAPARTIGTALLALTLIAGSTAIPVAGQEDTINQGDSEVVDAEVVSWHTRDPSINAGWEWVSGGVYDVEPRPDGGYVFVGSTSRSDYREAAGYLAAVAEDRQHALQRGDGDPEWTTILEPPCHNPDGAWGNHQLMDLVVRPLGIVAVGETDLHDDASGPDCSLDARRGMGGWLTRVSPQGRETLNTLIPPPNGRAEWHGPPVTGLYGGLYAAVDTGRDTLLLLGDDSAGGSAGNWVLAIDDQPGPWSNHEQWLSDEMLLDPRGEVVTEGHNPETHDGGGGTFLAAPRSDGGVFGLGHGFLEEDDPPGKNVSHFLLTGFNEHGGLELAETIGVPGADFMLTQYSSHTLTSVPQVRIAAESGTAVPTTGADDALLTYPIYSEQDDAWTSYGMALLRPGHGLLWQLTAEDVPGLEPVAVREDHAWLFSQPDEQPGEDEHAGRAIRLLKVYYENATVAKDLRVEIDPPETDSYRGMLRIIEAFEGSDDVFTFTGMTTEGGDLFVLKLDVPGTFEGDGGATGETAAGSGNPDTGPAGDGASDGSSTAPSDGEPGETSEAPGAGVWIALAALAGAGIARGRRRGSA